MKAVADSHAIVWYLQGSDRLSAAAEQALIESEKTDGLVLSVATLIDLWYVSQTTQAVTATELAAIRTMLDASTAVAFEPMTVAIADATTSIPRDLLKDPWDRFIVATALTLGLPVVTRDESIRQSDLVATIW